MTASPPPTNEKPAASAPGPQSGTAATVERATAVAEDFLDRGAPWSPKTSWTIVLAEGIVVALVGLMFIFRPLGGSSTTLQLVGLILLGGSLLTLFQLLRHEFPPDLEVLSAFRAGSGTTVGAVVIISTFLTGVTEAVVASLAVVIGIGFIVFGLVGIAGSLTQREFDVPLPLASLIINAVLALAGLVLMFAGAAGGSTVDGLFNIMGVLLIATGLALAGYSYMLRQNEASGV